MSNISEVVLRDINRLSKDSRGSFHLILHLMTLLQDKKILTMEEIVCIMRDSSRMLKTDSLERANQAYRKSKEYQP